MSNEAAVTTGNEKNVSMFRHFTNVIAGTGAFFAALHVFIGYMSLDKTPNETTGEIPKLFDNTEYIFYAGIAVLFFLTLLVSVIARRLPAIAILPSASTVTYLLLLYDADILLKGKMTFILFALFVFAGTLTVALLKKGRLHREFLRYTVAALGVMAAGWALTIYFRAPLAEGLLFGSFKPIKELDGLSAVLAYERLQALVELAKTEFAKHYLWSGVFAVLAAAVFLLLRKFRTVVRILLVLSLLYVLIAFSFGEMPYFPMFCVVPILLSFVGMMAFTLVEPEKETPRGEMPEGLAEAIAAAAEAEAAAEDTASIEESASEAETSETATEGDGV